MRILEEQFFKFLMIMSSVIVVGCLFLILGTIISKGISSLNLEMITRTSTEGFYIGKEGGILNAIIGSFYIAGGATLVGMFISISIVLYLNVYAKQGSRFAKVTRFSLDILFGIPSIIYGAFGFTIMVYFGLKTSVLAGIIAVTMLVIPILARTIDEVVRMVPKELFDATYSLGTTRLETGKVILRQTLPGIATAVLLSFGRAIGDAASVLFTAGYTDSIPTSLLQPAATLPLAIFFQLGSPIQEVQARAYAAALILTIIILLISITSRIIFKRLTRNTI